MISDSWSLSLSLNLWTKNQTYTKDLKGLIHIPMYCTLSQYWVLWIAVARDYFDSSTNPENSPFYSLAIVVGKGKRLTELLTWRCVTVSSRKARSWVTQSITPQEKIPIKQNQWSQQYTEHCVCPWRESKKDTKIFVKVFPLVRQSIVLRNFFS